MKKAVYFILIYFIVMICGAVFSTLIYSLYLNVTNFMAGKPSELFKTSDLIKSFFYVTSCLSLLICPLMSYYRVRHSYGFLQSLAYFFIFAMTWFLIFPLNFKLQQFTEKNYGSQLADEKEGLTGKYFRKVGDKIYYLVEDYNYDKVTRLIEIDTDTDLPVKYGVVFSDEDFELIKAGKNYKDVIIKSTFDVSRLPFFIQFRSLVSFGQSSFAKGFIPYLCFLSLAFALFSVYGATSFFDWPLLNVCGIFFFTSAILVFNTLFLSDLFMTLKEHVYDTGFFGFLERYIDNSFLVFINLLTGLFFIITGSIKFILNSKSEKDRGEE